MSVRGRSVSSLASVASVAVARSRLAVAIVGALVGSSPPLVRSDVAPQERTDYVRVSLEAPSSPLRVGVPTELVAWVVLASGVRGPWLATPTSDGPALEVVRGRLSSIDADPPQSSGATASRLRVPVVPRASGTAIVRVRVQAYACERGRCAAVEGEDALVVDIVP